MEKFRNSPPRSMIVWSVALLVHFPCTRTWLLYGLSRKSENLQGLIYHHQSPRDPASDWGPSQPTPFFQVTAHCTSFGPFLHQAINPPKMCFCLLLWKCLLLYCVCKFEVLLWESFLIDSQFSVLIAFAQGSRVIYGCKSQMHQRWGAGGAFPAFGHLPIPLPFAQRFAPGPATFHYERPLSSCSPCPPLNVCSFHSLMGYRIIQSHTKSNGFWSKMARWSF